MSYTVPPTRTAAVAQHLFQGMQMNAQRDFLNENIGPAPGDQLVSAHDIAGPLNQGGKNGKRPATDSDGNSIVRQQHFPRRQPKTAKSPDLGIVLSCTTHAMLPQQRPPSFPILEGHGPGS